MKLKLDDSYHFYKLLLDDGGFGGLSQSPSVFGVWFSNLSDMLLIVNAIQFENGQFIYSNAGGHRRKASNEILIMKKGQSNEYMWYFIRVLGPQFGLLGRKTVCWSAKLFFVPQIDKNWF